MSFLTLFSMMKIFRYVFWSSQHGPQEPAAGGVARLVSVASLVGLGIVLGLGATWTLPYATLAAEQLLDPQAYIAAVLKEP